jgi:hypothetical protein
VSPNSPDALITSTNPEAKAIPSLIPVGPSETTSANSTSDEAKSTSPVGSGGAKIRLPAAILPDDVRPAVRPEDFLPFFQFPAPGGTGNVRVIVPVAPTAPSAPGTQPPSSATYIQTP